MQNLEVPVGKYEEFKSIYIPEVVVAINTKRGTVGQSAGKVVQCKTIFHTRQNLASDSSTNCNSSFVMPSEHLSDIDITYIKALESRVHCIAEGGAEEPTPINDTLFTAREILTMRGATTPQEMEAQSWFYGTFLKCIAGKRAWGSKQFYTDITSVLRTGNDAQKPDAVSISDEAFTIVLFKNDRHKWIEKHEKKCCKVQLSMKELTRKCTGSSQRGMSDKANLADGHPKAFKTFNTYCNLVQEDQHSGHCHAAEKTQVYCCSLKYW